jgi:hypothetical protein
VCGKEKHVEISTTVKKQEKTKKMFYFRKLKKN